MTDILDHRETLGTLTKLFADISEVVDAPTLRTEIEQLEQAASDPNLWDDQANAQKVTSQLSHKQAMLKRLETLSARLDDAAVLIDMVEEETDQENRAEAYNDVTDEISSLEKDLADLETETLMNGEYDEMAAVVTIRAGAGGVDAADFAEILLRMYLRWAEQHGYPVTVHNTSYAEEAGIKSATFQVDSPYAFGKLSVEAGTHRLVRMSPFNSAGKRMTSFAAVEVVPMLAETEDIDIPEADIRVDVFRSSGPGGQSVNTTDSAVRITHIPTGIVVSCQNEKSQIQNRQAALQVLKSRLLLKQREEDDAKKKELAGNITASWGDQMRSYVLAPFQMVKDLRTDYEVNNPQNVFDGDLDEFISAGIRWRKHEEKS